MVDDLLDLSLVNERRELERLPVDLRELFDDTTASLSADITRRDARMKLVEPMPTVLGERCQLGILFQNLIGNALKFQRPDVPPQITVTCEELDEAVEVRVTDNGVGIPEEDRRKIFGRFERADSRGRYEGSGIGLSLVARVVANHGGSVRVESDGENGSSFVVCLPRGRSADLEPGAGSCDVGADELGDGARHRGSNWHGEGAFDAAA